MRGEPFKVKIPLSGDGPFDVVVKKNNKELPVTESSRMKISPFDDFCTIQLKGNYAVFVHLESLNY